MQINGYVIGASSAGSKCILVPVSVYRTALHANRYTGNRDEIIMDNHSNRTYESSSED